MLIAFAGYAPGIQVKSIPDAGAKLSVVSHERKGEFVHLVLGVKNESKEPIYVHPRLRPIHTTFISKHPLGIDYRISAQNIGSHITAEEIVRISPDGNHRTPLSITIEKDYAGVVIHTLYARKPIDFTLTERVRTKRKGLLKTSRVEILW